MIKASNFIRYFTIDPVKLSIKDKLLSVLICFSAIFISALITRYFAHEWQPILIASMGASAVILFIIPTSPLAQPWPFIGGQIFSALAGIACAVHVNDIALSASLAAGSSILIMLLLRCLHPPAAATALTPVLARDALNNLDYSLAIFPVAVNVIVMITIAIIVNRWLLGKEYPASLPATKTADPRKKILDSDFQPKVLEQDVELALADMDSFIDMTTTDLTKLHSLIENHTFQRLKGNLTCADIMTREVPTLEFATEVEVAWRDMIEQKVKVMPVLDFSRRIIGILAWSDFFKKIDLSVYDGFQNKIRQFIRRTPSTNANKPEAVGQLMTNAVVFLQDTDHIAKLIPLMSEQGYRQIPIVNEHKKLTGMVYQANLIAVLYHQELANC